MAIKGIDEIALEGKRVFIRVDFNVPLDDEGRITDDVRIRFALPTIDLAVEKGAKVIIASHLGRPKGKREEKYSLRPCAERLSELLSKEVKLAPDCIGPETEKMVAAMKPGDVVLLENLRFHKEETDDDEGFAKELAKLADVYVDDGFAVAHRANASVTAITRFVKTCAAGFLMKKEIRAFEQTLKDPNRPMAVIMGGGKVADKLGAVSYVIDIADKMFVGGAIGYTFIKALGESVGGTPVEEDLLGQAKEIIQKAKDKGVKLYLPVDCVAAQAIEPDAVTKICPVGEIPDGWMGLDIGPATVCLFREALSDVRTIVWNGPMGVYEMDIFSRGTQALVQELAASHAYTVVGGGDLNSAVHRAGLESNISYISTGGGAFVELLEGKTLPGIQVLEQAD